LAHISLLLPSKGRKALVLQRGDHGGLDGGDASDQRGVGVWRRGSPSDVRDEWASAGEAEGQVLEEAGRQEMSQFYGEGEGPRAGWVSWEAKPRGVKADYTRVGRGGSAVELECSGEVGHDDVVGCCRVREEGRTGASVGDSGELDLLQGGADRGGRGGWHTGDRWWGRRGSWLMGGKEAIGEGVAVAKNGWRRAGDRRWGGGP
jgi:hypothetical protein